MLHVAPDVWGTLIRRDLKFVQFDNLHCIAFAQINKWNEAPGSIYRFVQMKPFNTTMQAIEFKSRYFGQGHLNKTCMVLKMKATSLDILSQYFGFYLNSIEASIRQRLVIMHKPRFKTLSMRPVSALRQQTGAQYSVVKWAREKVAVWRVLTLAHFMPSSQIVSAE